MVDSQGEDDLFRHSSMTFGEHLEELRASLFKAMIALAVAIVVGLVFGFQLIRWIQAPLETALVEFYTQEAIEYIDTRLPSHLRNNQEIYNRVLKEQLIPQECYVDASEVLKELQAQYPAAFRDLAPPPAAPAHGLVRMDLWRPLTDDERIRIESFAIQEGFVVYLKTALLAGAIIAAPFMAYFLWAFVAAGLYPHEKRYVHVFMPISVGLFVAGAALVFLFVFPPVLSFFLNINKAMGQGIQPRISDWLNFVLLLPLCFGIAFQLPLAMLFMERIGLFTSQTYVRKWKIAVLIMAILAMVLTPDGSGITMMYMLVPLVFLYFLGIGMCRWMPALNRSKAASAPAKEYAGVE